MELRLVGHNDLLALICELLKDHNHDGRVRDKRSLDEASITFYAASVINNNAHRFSYFFCVIAKLEFGKVTTELKRFEIHNTLEAKTKKLGLPIFNSDQNFSILYFGVLDLSILEIDMFYLLLNLL